MPAILVASKMKSGLPKPLQSALPVPPARTGSLKPPPSSQIPLKTPVCRLSTGTLQKKSQTSKGKAGDSQIYMDWANHYLAKSGHKRLIKDLQQDVTDGVLLAEVIQVVANEKIADINGYPKSQSQMIENIEACLGFLAAKGVNIKGLTSAEIRSGNLKAILGLFFSLSRYKQQQQTSKQSSQPLHTSHTAQTQGSRSSSPALPPHTSPWHSPHVSPCPTPTPAHKAPADMLSSHPSKGSSSQKKALKLSVTQRKTSRLPGPSGRTASADSESKPRCPTNANANNRRSQSFNCSDKLKPSLACVNDREKMSLSPVMAESGHSTASAPPPNITSTNVSSTSTNSCKRWRSKSLSAKHTATSSSTLPVRQPSPSTLEQPPKVIAQKSMLEKLKLFNSKTGSRTSSEVSLAEEVDFSDTQPESTKMCPVHAETEPGNHPQPITSTTASSPKMALKGIAQRTISRALAPKKSSAKTVESDKDKAMPKEKDRQSRRAPISDQDQLRDETRPESLHAAEVKRTITTSKGSKSSKASSSHSNLPKLGPTKGSGTGRGASAPSSGNYGEQSRGKRTGASLSVHKGQVDGKKSSSSSSLVSSEIKNPQHNSNTTQSTASNTASVQLPQPQQQYSHPNTATVAPFIYRSQMDMGTIGVLEEAEGKGEVLHCKSIHTSLENLTREDPETRRLRTVKNIADLRQNLEETMSSLRGTQISHSTLETTFDSSVTTEVTVRGVHNLVTSRSATTLPRRLCPASPRLQAGDAPSVVSGYGQQHGSSSYHLICQEDGRSAHRQAGACDSALCTLDLSDKVEELESISMETMGYMSDGDVLGKNVRAESVNSGYMTDGGLSMYTRRLNCLPDSAAAVRDTISRNATRIQADSDSWDDSSSVSSGISDTDDINTSSSLSSYINTPSVLRRDIEEQPQTDAEKHSAVQHDSSWSGDVAKLPDRGSDSGVKMETGTKWSRHPMDILEESDRGSPGRKTPSISQTGSWRRGMTAQVGITTPRAKAPPLASCSSLKTTGTGKTDDAKVSEKGRLSPRPNGLHCSPSERQTCVDEGKKPHSSSMPRTPTNTFGFKKPPGSTAMITVSGAVLTSGSATLGRIPKSAGFSGSRLLARQSSVDDGYIPSNARTMLQYRSLPRPSRSSGSMISSRCTGRTSGSGLDIGLVSKGTATLPGPKSRASVKPTAGVHAPTANQTDREKGVCSDTENLSSVQASKANGTSQTGVPDQSHTGRQTGGTMTSPTLRRLFGGKSSNKQAPVTTVENMKNSTVISNPHAAAGQQGNTLEILSVGTRPPYSERLAAPAEAGTEQTPPSLTSNPSAALSPWGNRDAVAAYPSQTSVLTSSESVDVPLVKDEPQAVSLNRAGSIRTGLSDRYAHLPQTRVQEEARDWLRSHSAGGLQESAGSSPFSPASSLSPPTGQRFNFNTLTTPSTAAQMNLRSANGLTSQDGPCDSYSDPRLRNPSMPLDEKSRAMSSSGSFRDGLEEVHGSSLSLVSSNSSVYSTPEEKSQSEIRKLRRELEASQEKVSALTTQLSANTHLVAAFEQSLGNMTIRLQSLTTSAEQKDSELNELRKTIEMLKNQNTVAQAAINGVLSTPELTCKDTGSGNASPQPELRIHRQPSSDSVSSLTSGTSHSSVGSNLELDAKNKNKKKKNGWVYELRSSFKQAFGKKKSLKSGSSHSDIEEMTDSSLPASPKLPYNGSPLRNSSSFPHLSPLPASGYGWPSNSGSMRTGSLMRISECTDSEAETVMQLRSELRDKEMKLTDIRLEALSSAHQLDQLRESMNRMQNEIEKLRAENDRLKMDSHGSCSNSTSQTSASPSPVGPALSVAESTSLDMLLEDSGDGCSRKEGQHVKIVVSLDENPKWKEECRPRQFLIGCIGVSGKTKWDVLDGVVRRLFKEYIIHVDPESQLGLNSDSVLGYSIGEIHRTNGVDTPELLPCGYLVGDSDTISVRLKGVSENSLDSLVFETLVPKPVLQRYISQLQEHRRIIFSGPSGTGKTFLANRLAEYMVQWEGHELTDGVIATFNVDHKSSKELRQYLSNLADQCNSSSQALDMPLVVILDNMHHVSSLGDVFNGLLSCKHHRCPYIIGTMNQATSSTPNLQLHQNFRWVLCANHMEPVKGFLGRFLRRKLIETEMGSRVRNAELAKIVEWIPCVWNHLNHFLETHSSSDVTIGPRLFLSCPTDVDGSQVWFTDLWNYSIIPYMLEAVREGLQLYGRRAAWEDPAKWVMESYPWPASPQQHNWPPLLHLRPEDVGFDGYSLAPENSQRKQPTQGETEEDPLLNMLMRLKEAAHSNGPQGYDSDSNSNSNHDDVLDSSLGLESTL
ncbi:neuron navigator 2 [Chanos chanos]|uniref:Neuron navigator 2 n=1 Tax=Chanos chanos TaxID=29144 RepID=A0A6J2WLP7_CHACN|nr:neuron navigator 2-like [Chanos chanos]